METELLTRDHCFTAHSGWPPPRGYRSKGTSKEKFCPLSVNTRIYCKGRIPVLRAVLWFLYISEAPLLPPPNKQKIQLKKSNNFLLSKNFPSGILLLLLDDQRQLRLQMHLLSEHPMNAAGSLVSEQQQFSLDSVLSMKRHLPLLVIPIIHSKWINKVEGK